MKEQAFCTPVQLELNNCPKQVEGVDSFHFQNGTREKVSISWEYTAVYRSYGIASISPRVISKSLDLSSFVDNRINEIDDYLDCNEDLDSLNEKEIKEKKEEQIANLNKIRTFELVDISCEIEPSTEGRAEIGLLPIRLEVDLKTRTGVLFFQSTAP